MSLILSFVVLCFVDHKLSSVRGLCGRSLDDAMLMWQAVKRKDIEGVRGLIARGKAFEVQDGTEVRVMGGGDFGISPAIVETGAHVGDTCWAPDNDLKGE
jgi:hypothetical protein